MNEQIYTIEGAQIPHQLREIPQAPKKLFVHGSIPGEEKKILCVVGTRRHSKYGEETTQKLISGLQGYNICIVSGLALGIDGIAHHSALEAGLQTVAFPGSGLDPSVLYPSSHKRLAEEIVRSGGGLVSEYDMTQPSLPWVFPQRNRLMAGISQATVVIEAKLPSGSLITTKLATEYNRDVGAVPGQIDSELSAGTNMLIRSGAVPITCSADILEMLGFERPDSVVSNKVFQKDLFLGLNENEKKIIEQLKIENLTSEQIVQKTGMSARDVSETLSALEIQGLVKESFGRFGVN